MSATYPRWTSEQLDALAPDASSIKAAQKLKQPARWPLMGRSERALWGECKGSGKKPYQTTIDFAGPAWKCSCPSRKFPCKHSLALAYLYVEQTDGFTDSGEPDWASEWLNKRAEKATKSAPETDEDSDNEDPAAVEKKQAQRLKRVAVRERRVDEGVNDLMRWLEDAMRGGIAELAGDKNEWKRISQRMVDAQAGGLSSWLLRCADLRYQQRRDWQAQLLRELSSLYLLCKAWLGRDQLPTALADDVRAIVGFNVAKETLMTLPAVDDVWQLMGQRRYAEDRLTVQRSWLYGAQYKQYALLLDYGRDNNPLPLYPAVGSGLNAAVHFHPSATPARVALGPEADLTPLDALPKALRPVISIDTLLQQHTGQLTKNPWWRYTPGLLTLRLVLNDGVEVLQDNDQCILPVSLGTHARRQFLAISGGQFIQIFGEWSGHSFTPLSVFDDERAYDLAGGV